MKYIISYIKNLSATDVIAFYAAVISTIALVWNIIISITEKTPRMKINIGTCLKFTDDRKDEEKCIIKIIIVNKSLYDIYIKEPYIKLPEKIDSHNRYGIFNLSKPNNYPILIKPREQYKTEIEISENLITLLKRCNNLDKKISIEVTETTGKQFESNKLQIAKLIKIAESRHTENF